MKFLQLIAFSTLVLILTNSCTKEINANLPNPALKLVVDGSIETDVPPILTLTRTTKIFGGLNLNDLGSFFVHDADIWITDVTGNDSVKLVEFCLQDLPFNDTTKAELLKGLGILAFDSNTVPNVCIYTVPDIINYVLNGTCQFYGKQEHAYAIRISAENKLITGTTSIPKARPVNFLSVRPHPNPQNDSLVNVLVNFSVPGSFGNFVRYWTKQNSDPFYPPLSQSVYDDKLFSGLTIELPLERGQPQSGARGDDKSYGFFWKGDTVTLKWANIDSRTYDFFITLENDGTGNPFANQVRIKSTVEGGLGGFVGYASTYSTIIIPK